MAELSGTVHEAITLRKDSMKHEASQCSILRDIIQLETVHLHNLQHKLLDMETKLEVAEKKVRTNHHNQTFHKQLALYRNNVEFIDMTIVRKKNYIDLLSEMLRDKESAELQVESDCSLIIKDQHKKL